jgi:hypothetical protein
MFLSLWRQVTAYQDSIYEYHCIELPNVCKVDHTEHVQTPAFSQHVLGDRHTLKFLVSVTFIVVLRICIYT